MKKTFVFFSLFLMTLVAFARENEHSLLVVPRVDANPYIGGNQSFDLGNTSLYTLFEGELGESFSYSVMNHWLSAEPLALYQNTLRSDDANWLDWAYVTAYFGNFDISAGKQGILTGSVEQDAYDYDVCPNLSSTVWNNFFTYNWGLTLGYTNDEENTYLATQVTVSPFGEYNNSGLFAYSLFWSGEYDFFQPLWSANVLEYKDVTNLDAKDRIYMLSLGNRFSFDELELAFECVARSYDAKTIFNEEISLIGSLSYDINQRFDVMLKGGWESNRSGRGILGGPDMSGFLPGSLALMDKDYLFGGLLLNYYPLDDVESLRLHTALATNNHANSLSVTIGATYYLQLF